MDSQTIRLLEQGVARREMQKRQHPLRVLFWECTLRCNLRCRHCGSACLPEEKRRDMPFGDFASVLDSVARHTDPNYVDVYTVGGEPLVRPDLLDCGREIRRRGFHWGFVTNGMLLDRDMLARCIEAGLEAISVSLDGLEDSHNWMRGHGDSFRRALQAIHLLTYTKGIVWDVITCVNRRNISELPRMREMLRRMGVEHWRIATVFPSGRAKDDADMRLTTEEYRRVLDFVAECRREPQGMDTYYSCEGFLGDYEGRVRNHPYRCHAGLTVASVLADGSISGCLSVRSRFDQGNIYRDDFWDVWQNRFQPFRDRSWMRQDAPCADCKVFRYCEGNGFHLRDDDGTLTLCNYRLLNGECGEA
ncbi:MAG: TIGR04133 family radical SAM/SPASM protein [Alloprevotella sp.]|nr:TIGR04133 family radical SAM/SPASM protein [Alloprevotella sp.]MBR1594933.1 TIGR04133 family radical SAM/SPASM protein [Alloprevotella sp.]MBR1652805.1 TIGR04133 family radical SAM/SPASM protein [Alloprevotella sp.]